MAKSSEPMTESYTIGEIILAMFDGLGEVRTRCREKGEEDDLPVAWTYDVYVDLIRLLRERRSYGQTADRDESVD